MKVSCYELISHLYFWIMELIEALQILEPLKGRSHLPFFPEPRHLMISNKSTSAALAKIAAKTIGVPKMFWTLDTCS